MIGGAFEYFTSWFMEVAFGIRAWDYTGQWLSIDGRTLFPAQKIIAISISYILLGITFDFMDIPLNSVVTS